MKTPLGALVLAAMLAPAGATAQAGWWTPVAERLPASEERPLICNMFPDLPACADASGDRTPENPGRRGGDSDEDGAWGRADDDRRDRDDDRDDDEVRGRRGNGPPFCRDGRGHPVHGRGWCRDKGWDDESGWRDVGWEDVILGRTDRRDRDRLDRRGLADILGSVILGRLDAQGRRVGGGELSGRLVEGRTRVLQVRAGDRPLAELLDVNRDGRVDRILLREPR